MTLVKAIRLLVVVALMGWPLGEVSPARAADEPRIYAYDGSATQSAGATTAPANPRTRACGGYDAALETSRAGTRAVGLSRAAKPVTSADEAVDLARAGRSGKQQRLRELADDPNAPSWVRGWIRQELNAIARGQRKRIRVPPGYELAHRYGQEARRGFGYEFSDLKDILMHRSQHRIERELGR